MDGGLEMTETRRLELEEKLNLAEAHGDPKEIEAVKKTIEYEYRVCTSHTADRLKRVEQVVNNIEKGLIPADMFGNMKTEMSELKTIVNDLHSEIEKWKHRSEGAKILWNILVALAAAGGGSLIIKMLNTPIPGVSQ